MRPFCARSQAGEGNAISRAKSGAALYARLVRFLMLTLQRLDEGASLKGGDIIDSQWRFITKGKQTLPAETAAIGAGSDRSRRCARSMLSRQARQQDHRLVEAQEQAGRAFQRERLGVTTCAAPAARAWKRSATTRHLCTSYSTIRDRDCHPSTCTPTCLTGWARPWASGPARSSASPVPAAPFRKVS